jgi:hypothetical protein
MKILSKSIQVSVDPLRKMESDVQAQKIQQQVKNLKYTFIFGILISRYF